MSLDRQRRHDIALRASDTPTILVERIEAALPAPAHFSIHETDEWPKGVFEHLQRAGLLQADGFADAGVCPGCERQCQKSIAIRMVSSGATRQAYINCDEEPGLGRILVSLRSLTQYKATLAGMCTFISELMKLERPLSSTAGATWLLGAIKGRHGPRQVSVGLDAGRLMFNVGRQQESLARVLRWIGGRLSVDMDHIRRLANRKESGRGSRNKYVPDRTRQLKRSLKRQSRNEAIFREAKRQRMRGAENGLQSPMQ